MGRSCYNSNTLPALCPEMDSLLQEKGDPGGEFPTFQKKWCGYPNSWMVYKGTSQSKMDDLDWFRGYSHLWKHPNGSKWRTWGFHIFSPPRSLGLKSDPYPSVSPPLAPVPGPNSSHGTRRSSPVGAGGPPMAYVLLPKDLNYSGQLEPAGTAGESLCS